LRHAVRLEVPVRVLLRHPLLALDRLEAGQLRHPARRVEVVEDRLVAGEALEAHHLLGEKRPVLTELDVPLAGNLAEPLVERHTRNSTRPRRRSSHAKSRFCESQSCEYELR